MPLRALLATLLLSAPAVVAAGCGGEDAPTPEDEVRSALTAYADATAKRDEQRLCDRLLSRDLVTRVQRAGLPCEQAFRVALEDVRDPKLEVQSVKVAGERAEARVRTSATGQAPSVDTVRLVREAGSWRIASLAG